MVYGEVFSGGYSADSRTKCEDQAFLLGDNITWMIVALAKAHSSTETMTIKS